MPDWINFTALPDIPSLDLTSLNDDALYRNLDELHPKRGMIETLLTEKEKNLFDLYDTIYLYGLTSTYFEGMSFDGAHNFLVHQGKLLVHGILLC